MVTRRGDVVQVQYANKWQPHGRDLDYAPIEAEIRRLIRTYNAIEFCYDPYQLHDMAGRIRAEEVVNVRPFNQASARAIADKRLYDIIRDKRVEHKNEPDLQAHIMNANRKPEEDNRLRIVKRDDNSKIDMCVCLSMAVDRTFAYAMD
jgi:phage terminase large subunit-like protein